MLSCLCAEDGGPMISAHSHDRDDEPALMAEVE